MYKQAEIVRESSMHFPKVNFFVTSTQLRQETAAPQKFLSDCLLVTNHLPLVPYTNTSDACHHPDRPSDSQELHVGKEFSRPLTHLSAL